VHTENSIRELFRNTVAGHADAVAYRFKKDGAWHDLTWAEHAAEVERVSRALMALGLSRGDRVCILSDTRLEWVQCDFGIVCAGGVTVGIYPSSLADDCAYIVNHSDAAIVFVQNPEQLEKLTSVRDRIGGVSRFVLFDGAASGRDDVLTWSSFLALADSVTHDAFQDRAASLGPDDLASLVYTSGTTGVPKGAMITHGNLVFTSWSVAQCLDAKPSDITILFLPLAHVFARLIVYLAMRAAVTLAFAESMQTVGEDLKVIRPHFFASVPRVYEKVYDKIVSGAAAAGGLKAKLFDWAVGVGRQAGALRLQGKPVPGGLAVKHAIANKLVFSKIQAALGGRVRWTVSGAAPLNKTIAEFFHACGVLILEGLGMTENTSFSNVNREDRNKFGTVGPVGPGIEMKIADDGEVLFRGPNVMKGYFKSPEATAETIDADGWLFTGDVGEIDEDGFLRITDRKKDLIITAGGKNIAPARIEGVLKTSRFVSQAMAYGDRRKFLVALLTLDLDQVEAWAVTHGVSFDRRDNLVTDPRVRQLIDAEVADANRRLASFESVKKVAILPGDFTVESGELTPTLKLKRKVVTERHRDTLESLYAE